MIRIRRAFFRGTRWLAAAAVAMLAVWGAAGAFPAVAQASSSTGPTWTQQAPVTHPPGEGGAMAYDGANGTVVLFVSAGSRSVFGETWTWDGSTWTRHTPATRPPARSNASMAYDAATSTVVLFAGASLPSTRFHDTWTWG
jgi:hypothetical protein